MASFLKRLPCAFPTAKGYRQLYRRFLLCKGKAGGGIGRGGHYAPPQMEKDTIRTNELESMDLTVVRICNLDIDRNFRGVCEYIDMAVKHLSLSQLR